MATKNLFLCDNWRSNKVSWKYSISFVSYSLSQLQKLSILTNQKQNPTYSHVKITSKFVALPSADASKPSSLAGGFTGEGGRVVQEGAPADDDGEGKISGEVLESDVLANAVADIDGNTAVVPKGAWVVNPTHNVVANKLFFGLSGGEAADLDSYFHFRRPASGDYIHALDKEVRTFIHRVLTIIWILPDNVYILVLYLWLLFTCMR